MIRKAVLTSICLLLVMGVAVVIAERPLSLAADEVRFGTPHKLEPHHSLAMLTGEEKGFFKAAGLEVKWFPFHGGGPMQHAVIAGEIDMGATLALSLVKFVPKGVPFVIVADLEFTTPFYLSVLSDSPIKRPKDLNGAKIGVSKLNESGHAYAMLVANSLGLGDKVKYYAAGGYSSMVAALKRKIIDTMLTDFFVTVPLRLKGLVRPIVAIPDYLPKEWTDLVLFARIDFVKKKPDVVRRFVKAYFQATNFVMREPEWAIEKMKSFTKYDERTARETLKILSWSKTGRINPKRLENVTKFAIDQNLLDKEIAVPVERLYTTKFTE